MLNVYETLLSNIKNHFKQEKRTNHELKHKLHQMFQDNVAEYEKFVMWYDKNSPTKDIFGKMEYEHYAIENYKKSVYGDSYEIKEYTHH